MSTKEDIASIIAKRNKLQEFIKLDDRLQAESSNHIRDEVKYTDAKKLIHILNNKIMLLKSLKSSDSVSISETTITTKPEKNLNKPIAPTADDTTNKIKIIRTSQVENQKLIEEYKLTLIETQTNVVNSLNKLISIQPNQNIKLELISRVTQATEHNLKIQNNINLNMTKLLELQQKLISSIESNKNKNIQQNIRDSCITKFRELGEFIIKCTSDSTQVFQTLSVRLDKVIQQESIRQESIRQESIRQESIRQSNVSRESIKQANNKQEVINQANLKREAIKQLQAAKTIEKAAILIVMPTYNRSENIENSIAMINAQTYNNWVFLIIDDGSSEIHKHKFGELKKKYQSTKIIFQENKVNCHIAKTLNKGIHYLLDSCTNFTHFTWISDDNEYYPNFLAELYNENTFFKYGSYNVQELNGNINTTSKKYLDFDDLLNNFAGCASFMWTKEAINEIGCYDETVHGCEDFEYLLRTFKLNDDMCNFTSVTTMKYIRNIQSGMEQNREAIMALKNDIINKFNKSLVISKYTVNNCQYKISIVMAYYNRKPQTLETLKGFERNYLGKYSFEVIIVDDNSNDENRLEEEIKQFSFPINLIVISKQEKGNRINPCTAYNRGFAEAVGEIIIIQNPECYHVGDIIEYTINNLKEQDYFTYSCFSANSSEITNKMLSSNNIFDLINSSTFLNSNLDKNNVTCWYNHPTYSIYNTYYHFCSAIYKSKLDLIGGFDKTFANGYCYDDNELILSIIYNLNLNMHIIDTLKCFVIHQYHTKSNLHNDMQNPKLSRNCALYNNLEKIHMKHDFKYPKLLFLYWDGSPLSYLNFLTVSSFNKYNPGWKIIVFIPEIKTNSVSWLSHEQKLKYDKKCYFSKLHKIPNVVIKKIDLNEIGFYNDASEVIKSDYFRYYILYKHGGLWSDFDIIYTSSVEEKMSFYQNSIIFKCFSYGNPKNKNELEGYKYYPIGFFLSKPDSKLFKYICDNCKQNYNPDEYQSIGAVMWGNLFPTDNDVYNIDDNIKICDYEYYLPWAWNELYEFLEKNKNTLPPNNVGIHWFNGADKSKQYAIDLESRLDINRSVTEKCYLDSFINTYART